MRRHGGRWGLSGSGDGLTARNRSSVGARRRCSDGLCADAAQEALAVGDQGLGAQPRTARFATDRLGAVDERPHVGDVVAVAAGQADGQRDAGSVDQEMVLSSPRWARSTGECPVKAPLKSADTA